MIVFTEQMKREALTAVLLYWREPIKGYKSAMFYSFDTKNNKKLGYREPGIERLIREFVIKRKGQYNVALIIDNQDAGPKKRVLRAFDYYGNECDPNKYNKFLQTQN